MSTSEHWYVVKQADGHCMITPASQMPEPDQSGSSTADERWGPYATEGEAIARRVGLIRAGKCKPA